MRGRLCKTDDVYFGTIPRNSDSLSTKVNIHFLRRPMSFIRSAVQGLSVDQAGGRGIPLCACVCGFIQVPARLYV